MPDANKVTFVQRKNTVCIDIKQVAGLKVPSKDWVTFLKDDVKLNAEDVVECQVHSVTGFLLVKLHDELLYQEVCDKLQQGIPWSIRDGAKVFGWSTQDALASVKIINMTVHIDEKCVIKHMENYGTVVHHRIGYIPGWKGVRDGSLTLKMKLKEGVVMPSFLDLTKLNGEILQIFSDQQEKTCFRCLGKGHIAPFCRRKAKEFSDHNKSQSWASITAQTVMGGSTPEGDGSHGEKNIPEIPVPLAVEQFGPENSPKNWVEKSIMQVDSPVNPTQAGEGGQPFADEGKTTPVPTGVPSLAELAGQGSPGSSLAGVGIGATSSGEMSLVQPEGIGASLMEPGSSLAKVSISASCSGATSFVQLGDELEPNPLTTEDDLNNCVKVCELVNSVSHKKQSKRKSSASRSHSSGSRPKK